jgi:predicted TPR repeat methyltransferase
MHSAGEGSGFALYMCVEGWLAAEPYHGEGEWRLSMNRKQRSAQGETKSKASPQTLSPEAKPDGAALHEAGIQAYRAGELARAAELIGRAIAASGPAPELHYNLAIVLKAMGQLQGAADHYDRAIALKPDYINAHNNLGNVWKTLGQPDKARASFARALQHNPDNADTHYSLGILHCEMGERAEAERHFRHCLACDPHDRRGAEILLAHLGAGEAPGRTPAAHLLSLYDERSRYWDEEKSYFAPMLVAEAFRRHALPAPLDVLDIGCGTGSLGALVRGQAAALDGVDISAAMLEKATAKNLYDHLFQADLVPFMASHERRYDAILAAATLIHFGDLKPLVLAASRCLRDQGLLVFTLFCAKAEAEASYAVAASTGLAQSGCFEHSPLYVDRLARETGFNVLQLEKIVHEHDQDGNPVAGLLVVLRRAE